MSEGDAVAFLDQLQRATFDRWHLAAPRVSAEDRAGFIDRFVDSRFPDASPEDRVRLAAQLGEEMAAMSRTVPTRYERPEWYAVMTRLAGQVREAAVEEEFTLPSQPVLGTLPTGRINAVTVPVPGTGDHLVLFEWQLFTFALLFSKAIVRAMPMETDSDDRLSFVVRNEEVLQRLADDPSVAGRFTELITAYAVTGIPGNARPYLPEPHYGAASEILLDSMELFVMAHEYGHVGLGHLSEASLTKAKSLDNAEAIEYSWQQEFEADVIGLSLMMRAMHRHRKVDAALSYWGADAFFSAIDVMEQAVSVLRTGTETARASATHPPSKDRRELLRAVLPRIVGDEHAEAAVGLSHQVEFITEALWERARQSLVTLHERGVRPAAWWLG